LSLVSRARPEPFIRASSDRSIGAEAKGRHALTSRVETARARHRRALDTTAQMRLLDGSPSAQYVVSRELVVMLDAPRAGVPRRVRERFESASETHPSSNDERRAVSNERDVEVGCESRYEQPFLTTRLRA
jgi:hypothetical protein